MLNNVDRYINVSGDFEFPNFLYHTVNSLMKSTLDLGTLACTNDNQLRAFKETVKKNFKQKWQEIADILFEFGLIEPCICSEKDYCRSCGGSRFITTPILNADHLQETSMVLGNESNKELKIKLQLGLEKALWETSHERS